MNIYLHKVKSRWQPGENTVAYYPLTENANDYSGNGYNATNYEGVFSEQNGCYFGTILSRLELPSMTIGQTFTINAWIKLPNGQPTGNKALEIYYDWSGSYRNILYDCGAGGITCLTGNNGTSQNNKTVSTTFGTGRNNIIISKTGTSYSIYKNGNLLETFSSSYNVSIPGGRNTVSVGHVYNETQEYAAFGYIKDYIIENKARTAEEVEDYYMLTKGDYYAEIPWEPNGHTLSYFPLKSDADDVIGTRGLTLSGTTISDGVANISAKTSYMQLSNTIGGTNMTASLWYYPTAFNTSGNGDWNTIFARNGGTYHHLLISGGNSAEGTVGRIGFWNNSWTGSSAILDTNKWYNIIMTKSGTNEKIYVNGSLVLDSNSSFDNAAYQLGIIANYSPSGDQGAHGKISEVIFEDKVWTADEVLSYYYQTRNDYIDDPWYPVKEYSVENIYIGHLEGYQPNANTVIYFPLTDDMQDYSGKSVTVSTTGSPTITTLDGVKCCYFNGSSTIDTSATVSDTNTTWSAWVYQPSAGSMFLGNQPCGIHQGIALSIDSNGFTYSVYGGSPSTSYGATASGTYTGGWHHFLVANKKLYVDGVYKTTTSGSYQVGGTQPVNLGGHNVNSSCTRSKITGYMGETFIESGEWTAEKVAEYYNHTKSNYGL